jgi:thioredoxin-related protein
MKIKTFVQKSVRYFSLTCIVFSIFLCHQNAKGNEHTVGIVFFQGSWSDVLAEAKKQNKHIFVDAFAEWCSPCKWMEKNIFTKNEVGKFYNQNFISYRMDMEKGIGVDLYKKYNLTGYPTYLFFKPYGEIIHHTQGWETTEPEFIQIGKDVFDENKALYALKKKFDQSNHEPSITLKYLMALKKAFIFLDKYGSVTDAYTHSQPQPIPLTKENLFFIKEFVTDLKHPFYRDLLQRETDYAKAFGNDETKSVIYTIQMTFYADKKDWKNYGTSALKYLESVRQIDNSVMVSMAWNFIENIRDRKLLQKVVIQMQKTAKSAPTYDHLQTLANLLFKFGNKKEAARQARLAISKAKETGEDSQDMEDLLKKIK